MMLTSKCWSVVVPIMLLSGCSLFQSEQASTNCSDVTTDTCSNMFTKESTPSSSKLFKPGLHFVQIGEYTQQIAQDLKTDLSVSGLNGSVMITPFVSRQTSVQEADDLGYELAGYLNNDLQDIGISTSDVSMTQYLYMTAQGDIEFSTEQQEVFLDTGVAYVLTGNMRKTSSGLMLNTKIIELKSGKLVATNNKFLPNLVLGDLL
jgi:TolB-like protein